MLAEQAHIPGPGGTIIAHLDLDQFFVAVERLKNPDLTGKPVAVGGSQSGRGVISSASYEARDYGVHSAMPTGIALRKCPHLVVISSNFADYKDMSAKVFELAGEFTPDIERTSIDEGYMELGGCLRYHSKTAIEIVEELRNRIKVELGLVASFGISLNRMMAKIGSDWAKPYGILSIFPGKERCFLAPLAVRNMPGIGPRTEERLKQLGIYTLGELAECDEGVMRKRFGVHGTVMVQRARGISRAELQFEHFRKSVGHECTFREDIDDPEKLLGTLHHLSSKVSSRMRKLGMTAKVVRVKVRFGNFETITRSITLKSYTDSDEAVYSSAVLLAEKHFMAGRSVRLVGVSVSRLVSGVSQVDLFPEEDPRRRLINAVDAARKKFEFKAISTADSLGSERGRGGMESVSAETMLIEGSEEQDLYRD